MKIYVAARATNQIEAKAVAAQLRSLGHEITAGWLDQTELDNPTLFAGESVRDLADLDRADAILLLTSVVDGGKGMWVELGYALGKGLKVFVYPHLDTRCVFMYLKQIQLITSLTQISQPTAYPQLARP